ncbi:MAG: DNA-binding transcriptional regulator Fis [Luminiphilus sp.]|nr:DNA-binding transcriptional regulator Fis [Luminiphilus sp.]
MTAEKNTVAPRPLRESAKESITHFFEQLDGATCSDLHALVLAQVEEPLFRAVLQETGGNQSKAAAMLGLNRGTLRKKLRQYHLI